ncbi:MAG: hypothetical protein ACWA44_02450 [Thiotrichales bacterium]
MATLIETNTGKVTENVPEPWAATLVKYSGRHVYGKPEDEQTSDEVVSVENKEPTGKPESSKEVKETTPASAPKAPAEKTPQKPKTAASRGGRRRTKKS